MAWPLLTGERGNYELEAHRKAQEQRFAQAMERFAVDATVYMTENGLGNVTVTG
ncbi:hypothetical protein HZF08_01650 [Paenibacillus sp. CGMCC 1.16610]|uniref:Uncharacterized protein n=1 Tax=Paenibacillus anseongense TaxID=2682845 RepID=A0ABW9U2P1_9BACL|nr:MULTISPECIES: hypothetical protein [Paenibacillus]MBA2937005.1 hypothetical protein [Paenibacillus sp. CGMCC 1.16610]MVQ33329.1 hypothetical protein [Paenibacillus anseongense]